MRTMARVADYVIIRDAWKVDAGGFNTITFTVPNNIDVGSRCVLNFMFKAETLDDTTVSVAINGTTVWNWTASGAVDPPIRCMQEVVDAHLVKPGENIFQFDTNSGDFTFTELSDIVLWIQANI
jgi:hypothetical protein